MLNTGPYFCHTLLPLLTLEYQNFGKHRFLEFRPVDVSGEGSGRNVYGMVPVTKLICEFFLMNRTIIRVSMCS